MDLVDTGVLARSRSLRGGSHALQRLVFAAVGAPHVQCCQRSGAGSVGLGGSSRPDLVSIGKVILVILATLVIFSTGLITGVVVIKQVPKPPSLPFNPPPPPQGPGMQQFLRRIE